MDFLKLIARGVKSVVNLPFVAARWIFKVKRYKSVTDYAVTEAGGELKEVSGVKRFFRGLGLIILFLLIGVMLYTHYQQVPLPQALTRPDQILPLFVVSELQNGLAGFIVAAIVAAALSPSLNAMAATTVSDFYLPYINPSADQATQMRVSKQATVAWGVVQLAVAIGAQFMNRSVLDAGLAVLSFASGSVLGAFLLGTLAPSVRERDTFAGMIAGLVVMTGVWWATPIAFTWYVLIGAVTTCLVALVSRQLSPLTP